VYLTGCADAGAADAGKLPVAQQALAASRQVVASTAGRMGQLFPFCDG
jgi:hypothetical protein